MTRSLVTSAALLALVALVAGCKRPRAVGHFGDAAYYHSRDHYRIRYRPDDERVLPPEWRIVNYHVDPDSGRPTTARDDARYWTHYAVDHGRRGTRQVRAERIDLRYEHATSPAMIWVRTVPTSQVWSGTPLSMMLRDAVRGLTTGARPGLDLVGHPLGPPSATTSELRDEGDAVVDGLPARWATFDLRNRDTGAVDRFTVVLLRPGEHHWRYRRHEFPMLVIFGLASRPAEHATFRPALEGLVQRVDVAAAP